MINVEPKIDFEKAWASFILSKRNQDVSDGHMFNYQRTLTHWRTFHPDLKLEDTTSQSIREWIEWLRGEGDAAKPAPPSGRTGKLSSGTVHVHYRNMRCFLAWCEREELIDKSPMHRVDAPVVEEVVPDILKENEIYDLLMKVKGSGHRNAFRDYLIHFFFLDTDMRLNEFVHLDLDDLDVNVGYVVVRYGKRNPRKGGYTKRTIGLGKELRKELSMYLLKWRQPADPNEKALFVNEQGKRFENQGVRSMIVRDMKKYIGRTLNRTGSHTHRHSGTTIDMKYLRNKDMVMRKAGHTEEKTTERYVHLARADFLVQETSAMDELMRSKGGEIRYKKQNNE
jgi:integrase/recombinase XerD